jgi:uncharacterized protein (DUF934 family)
MLIKQGQFAEDDFTAVADGEDLPERAAIVSLKRFLAERETLLARNHPLGVRLETGESPESLAADLDRLALVVLHVAHFKDGRGFSWARLLRTRLGYRGEIRLSGHFLIDQIAFYTRVGVDSFAFAHSVPLDEIRSALSEISYVYQPSVDGRTTIRDLRSQSSAALPT